MNSPAIAGETRLLLPEVLHVLMCGLKSVCSGLLPEQHRMSFRVPGSTGGPEAGTLTPTGKKAPRNFI